MKMFWKQIDIMVAQHCKCTKCQGVANFEMVDFVLHEFHFNKKSGNKKLIGWTSINILNNLNKVFKVSV